ncbi:MAG: polyphenol oxidase family protein [Candidatus Paceibacterota bacterium]
MQKTDKDEKSIIHLKSLPVKNAFTFGKITGSTSEELVEEKSFVVEKIERSKKRARNRKRTIYRKLEIPFERVVHMSVDHGSKVKTVNQTHAWDSINADSLITSVPGLALEITPADCHPVFITNREGNILALIHAGVRSLIDGVIEKTFKLLDEEIKKINYFLGKDIKRKDLMVGIGPGICAKHYSVKELALSGELKKERRQKLKSRGGVDDLRNLNLSPKRMLKSDLLREGILMSNIVETDYCTYHSVNNHNGEHLFFSYRRCSEEEESEGRNLAIASL